MDLSVKVSVIIPVFNAEKRLRKCIESMLKQTFDDFELLLINDGSHDRSGAICDAYAQKDNRIKVFHKENGGVSSARNLGLKVAKGAYIVFCDADDWVSEHYLADLMNGAAYDLVVSSYHDVSGAVGENTPDDIICETKDEVAAFFGNHIFQMLLLTPWGKLWMRKIIMDHEIVFDPAIKSGQDNVWCLQYYQYVNSIRHLSAQNYFYQKEGNGHLSQSALNVDIAHYTVERIKIGLGNLEKKFDINLSSTKKDVTLCFFNRALCSTFSDSVWSIRKQFVAIYKERYFQDLFLHRDANRKGKRRKVFDWLMFNRCFLLLAVYIKMTKKPIAAI